MKNNTVANLLISSGLLLAFMAGSAKLSAQTCDPKAYFSYVKDGEQVEREEQTAFSGSAPVTAYFEANPSDDDGYEAIYEWWIYPSTGSKEQYIVHHSGAEYQTTEYTFTQSGSYVIALKVTFSNNSGSVDFPEVGENTFTVSVAESRLEMPNAFSPNGDEYNEVYRAKPNHQSIVEFKATIFNRWGQRLYSWDDVNGGWDGKVNGRVVPAGVYYVNVVAKGADGVEYKIRKDVNVLTDFREKDE